MLLYVGKVILLFSISVVVIRLLGKAALAQLTPHDLTAIVFLATLAVTPLISEDMGRAIIGIVVVTILHIIFSKLSLFRWLNRLLIGEPTILIRHGKIIKQNLKRSHYSLIELLATLRAEGYPDLKNVEYAILEPTGDISVIPSKDSILLTPKHLNLDVEYEGMPISLIIEGKIQHKNLNLIGKDAEWLKMKLEQDGYHKMADIFYAAVRDTDESLIIDTGKEFS
ncbi:DUF421 domain-containing protein [Paenibacillus sediminis]|uniref:Uncharacterized membrane protein YcaP (DUF421 family) n=1 Tax=Paenibacillus sediminis TaxID=664909 RepID=A0ABS4H0B8_9BACL|nr:uncharacterized membrane protein YcaP (DUF421 family) [Paenibacillus sediminis]